MLFRKVLASIFLFLLVPSLAFASGDPERAARNAAQARFDTNNREASHFTRNPDLNAAAVSKSAAPSCPGASKLDDFDETMSGEGACLKDDNGNITGVVVKSRRASPGEGCSKEVLFSRLTVRQRITRTEIGSDGQPKSYCVLLNHKTEKWDYDCVNGSARMTHAESSVINFDNNGTPLSVRTDKDTLDYGDFTFAILRRFHRHQSTIRVREQGDDQCPKITANLASLIQEKSAFGYPSNLYNPKSPCTASECVENGGKVPGCGRTITSRQWRYMYGAELNNNNDASDDSHFQWTYNFSLIVQDYVNQCGVLDLSKRIVVGDTVAAMGSVNVSAIRWFHTDSFGLAALPASLNADDTSGALYDPNWNNFYVPNNLPAPICGSCKACTNNACPPDNP